MDDKNGNIKEISGSQNKNSVIVKGDNVNVTNQIVINNNYYGASESSGGSNSNEPEKQCDSFLPKQRRFSPDSFFSPVNTSMISLSSVAVWVLLANVYPPVSLFIMPAVQSIAGYYRFRSSEKRFGKHVHSFLCSAIILSVILIAASCVLFANSVITHEMLVGCLIILIATNMFSFFCMYFNIVLCI